VSVRFVSVEDVLQIHETLVSDFAGTDDPISPAGVRSLALLQSAIGRQATGIGNTLKYPRPTSNAATLLYGLCNDHPFYNGNKRTALVSMLVHLDKNKLTLFGTSQTDLYDLMLRVASHTIAGQPDRRAKRPKAYDADEEVERIDHWIGKRADRVQKGERHISYRELRRILERFGFQLANPRKNTIEVVRLTEERRGILKRRMVNVQQHIATIGWPGEGKEVSIGSMKGIRRACKLREEDGVDSDSFYNDTAIIDSFVNRYRAVLRRLARV
jgi:death-on-curing protein